MSGITSPRERSGGITSPREGNDSPFKDVDNKLDKMNMMMTSEE